ncbi:TonB-dependent receptor [Pontibacter sp. G13]|uniref:SusC/RagA family TonB-linked outer membrane protein n=1 Tax=Pontibacter sp. G13 TaxID=3074898 RepID=UPI00288AFCE2|nr:TonB-dependent receptor [Pontibacter sp. G13]WNJ17708.1 TonB-dependent receptor [Pontibacter sp. G13]
MMKKCTIKFFLMILLFGVGNELLAQRQVSGKITDSDSSPLIGASVLIKGTTNGVITDGEGAYSITVDSDTQTLMVSYVGYTPQSRIVGNASTLNFTMLLDDRYLDEVVVVGYGSQRKQTLTGAIRKVDAEALEGRPVANFQSALQGQVAGLQITNTSGSPGGTLSVRVRGTSSITGGSNPLFVVDGNIISTSIGGGGNPFSTLNPSDIESVTVLKDASAAAIYGARAANGVILITTKRGTSGEAKISFNAFGGVQSATRQLDMLSGPEYQTVMNTVRDNAGLPRIVNLDGTAVTTNSDWQDELFRNAGLQSYELTASGGNGRTSFYTSLSHYDEQGTVIGTGFQRTNLRVNTDTRLGKFKFGNSMAISRSKFDKEFRANGRGPVFWALANSPAIDIYNPDNTLGGFNGPSNADGDIGVLNPIASQTLIDNESYVMRALGNVYGQYDILENLIFKVNIGVDVSNYQNRLFAPYYELGYGDPVLGQPNGAQVTDARGESMSFLWENTLNYKKTFGKHNVDVLAGYTIQSIQNSQVSVTTAGQNITPEFPVINASDDVRGLGGFMTEKRTESYIGRFIYDYDSRYLATFNFRRDGSSAFTRENYYDNFFSGSLGWVISNEAFMEDAPFSLLKLRTSWGFLGNDQINASATISTLNSNARYVFGDLQEVVNSVAPGGTIANPGLVWEKQEQLNIGLDMGWMNNAFTASIDYYIKNSNDLLLSLPLPDATGYSNIYLNAAEVRNRGLELEAAYNGKSGDFEYSIGANFGLLDNEVLSLAEGLEAIERNSSTDFTFRNRVAPGSSLFALYGYEVEGIYQSVEEIENGPTPFGGSALPGDLKYRDISGPEDIPDGIIDENDRTFIGDANQDFLYGFSLAASYKGFDFSAQFQGVAGNEIFNETKFYTEGYFRTNNLSTNVLDAWTESNPSTTTPRAIPSVNSNNDLVSSFFVEDGSYLRLKNLQLGYTLSSELMEKTTAIDRVRVYMAGQNLLTFTNYTGYDPEIGLNGIDAVGYPQTRRISFGVQLGF